MPETITSELGIQPTRVFAKGERYLSKTRDPQTKIITEVWRERPWGIWRLDTGDAYLPLRVEAHMLYLLNILEPRKNQINHYLKEKEGCSVRFYVERKSLNPSSIEVSSKTLERMSLLCHFIELYCL